VADSVSVEVHRAK